MRFGSKKFYFQTMFYDNDKNFFISRKSKKNNLFSIANFSHDASFATKESLPQLFRTWNVKNLKLQKYSVSKDIGTKNMAKHHNYMIFRGEINTIAIVEFDDKLNLTSQRNIHFKHKLFKNFNTSHFTHSV